MSYLNISLKNEVERMISARTWGVRGIGRERWVSGYKAWLARRKKLKCAFAQSPLSPCFQDLWILLSWHLS